jgi:Cu/Ag efflux protein CusF
VGWAQREERAFAHSTSPAPREQTGSFGLIADARKNQEVSMNLAKMMLAGAMLASIPSLALAQQSLTGTVTAIDRISGTIGIQQPQGGTVGAGGGGATLQEFKATEGMLENVHAGDKITFTASEIGGKKTITKIDQQ